MVGFETELAQAGTVVPGGSITTDTTWDLAGSPYWIQDAVTVDAGVTLTIDPGVEVKFRKDLVMHLYVYGTLIAEGTPSQIINFTSNATSPGMKDWGNIWIYSTGSASLKYINVTYGNIGVYMYFSPDVTVENSTFLYCERGVKINGGGNNYVANNTLSYNKIAVQFEDSQNSIVINNTLSLSSTVGVYSTNSLNNKIYHNRILNNAAQAMDDSTGNIWNNNYPSGGNYWSDWSPGTPDLYDGAITPQTTGSPDGICDNQYNIDGDSIDYYPLKYPYGTPPPDFESPTIDDVSTVPDPQEVYGLVNISAVINDNDNVSAVWVNITGPDGFTVGNYTMEYNISDDRYYYISFCDLLGTYDFTIWANDTNDNWNYSSGSFLVRDSIMPELSNLITIPSLQEVFEQVNVSIIVTDNFELFDVWINITYPNGSWENTTMEKGSLNEFFKDQSYDIIGVYDFTIWANDTSDNWNSSSGFFTIQDNTPPWINNTIANPSAQVLFGNVNISAIVVDNFELFDAWINISYPDGSSINITMDAASGDLFYFNQSYGQLGVYDFTVWANDTNGNWNSNSGFFSIGDSEPPFFESISATPDPQEVFGSVNISATITDDVNVYGAWVNITYPDNSYINITMEEALGDVFYLSRSYDQIGIYNVGIWANDTSNNWNFSNWAFTIQDRTPPWINNTSPEPPNQDVFGNINITAEVADNFELFDVWINISYPDGSSVNTTMNTASSDIFYFNQSYSLEGIHGFTIWANDTSGNWNFSSGFFVIGDSIPPSISNVASNPAIQKVFGLVNISADITDNYDLYGTWINITSPDGSSMNITMSKALGDSFYLEQNYNQIGSYLFTIWTNDTNNNWNFESGSFDIEDNTQPAILNLIANPDTQIVSDYVNISAMITDNYELFDVCVNISYPDGSFINVTMDRASGDIFYYNQSYPVIGTYDITIWANDTSDNWKTDTDSFLIFDPSIPTSSVEIIPPYWKNTTLLDITFTASDNTGLSNITLIYRYSPDNSSWGLWTEYAYNSTISGTSASGSFQFVALSDGYYEFFTNASDIDGNWEPDAQNAETMVAVDTSPPTSSLEPILLYWRNSSPLTIGAIIADEHSGVKEVVLWYRHGSDNLSWSAWMIFEKNESEPWSWDFDFPQGEGYYEFYSVGTDIAGNEELKSLRDELCAYDITPPEANANEDQSVEIGTTINLDGSGSSDNFGIVSNFTWTITKDLAVLTVLYGSNTAFEFDEVGEFRVNLSVEDPSGNTGYYTLTVSVIDLSIAPEITHSADPQIQEVMAVVNISAVVTDDIGVFGVWVQIFDSDGTELQNISMVRIGITENYWFERVYSEVGNYNYTIWANDTTGNWAFANGDFLIRDTTSPTAIAGDDKIIEIGSVINFDGSESSDNVGIINYSWNISLDGIQILTLYGINANHRFEEAGMYQVVLTVIDASGNSGNDMITIEVNERESKDDHDWSWLIILIIILVILTIFILILVKFKKKPKDIEKETPDSDVQTANTISELSKNEEFQGKDSDDQD